MSAPAPSTPTHGRAASPPPTTTTPANQDTVRKRARPTKSCLECRRKKLKCDRLQPCMQCKKLGREAHCTYANASSGPPITTIEEWERSEKRPRVEVSRLNSWGEAPTAATSPRESYAGTAAPIQMQRNHGQGSFGSQPVASGLLHINGSKSRYVAHGDKMALFQQFADERSFLMGCFKDPQMKPIMSEMLRYQKALHRKVKENSGRSSDASSVLVTDMLNALPGNADLEALTERYLVNMETVLRVVHVPTFRKQCGEIQNCRTSPNLTLPPSIPESVLAQLLAVVSIASRLSDSNDTQAASQPLSEEQIVTCFALIKKWLDGLKGKQRLNIDSLRAETLLLVAKSVNMDSLPELWKESGSLVRVAMAMGLHRDPESSTALSPFAKEQRRKLWQTIVELDMQFALAIGMPVAVQASDFNPRTLLHVNDEELVEDMPNYPPEKPVDVWSDALPQIILGSYMKHRLDATSILSRDIDFNRDIDRILFLAKDLEAGLRSLQATLPKQSKMKQRLFSDIMLDVHLRRPSLALYQTIALSEHSSRFPEARKGVLRNSIAILSHLDALDPAVADPNTIKSNNYLNFFHILCKDDIIRSALILCHEIRAFNSSSSTSLPVDPALLATSADDSMSWTKHGLTRMVENTLNNHLQRLGEFGSNLKVIVPLSVILQSVRSDGTSQGKRELMIRGTERIVRACRKSLPLPSNDSTPQNGNTPNMHLPQTPQSNVSGGGDVNLQGPPVQQSYQGGFMPIFVNGNPLVNGQTAFPNFDMNFEPGFSDFSDWEMMGQSWF